MKKQIKRVVAALLAVMIMSGGLLVANAANPEEAGMLPVRAIFEDMGATVTWHDDDRTIHIEIDGGVAVIHTSRPMAYVNDEARPLEDGIVLWQGRSFITEQDFMLMMGDPITVLSAIEVAFADIAESFMDKFVAGDIADMLQMMTAEMQAALVEMLPTIHQIALIQMGSFIDWYIADYQTVDSYEVFSFTTRNVIGTGGYNVVIDADGLVAGFTNTGFVFAPLSAYADAVYTAYPVVVGEGTPWPLNGLLTMPHAASAQNPVPAVVLVHGSGAHNMDSSIFDNRPFHDIATYLSSNGIAVLRYNKRTLTHGEALAQEFGVNFDNFTVWDETIEDALLAAQILRADPRVSRVYVAGLSLGGVLAPRIAQEGGLDGAIILAGAARPIFEAQYDQNLQAIADALEAGLMSQEEADEWLAMVADLLEEARNLPYLTQEEMQGMLVFGIPAVWQRSVMDALPLPIISNNPNIPVLIQHGTRDWQTLPEFDFALFEEYARVYEHVTAIIYDNVNHVLMQSQTPYNDLRDYMVPGHVDGQLLRDMVEWILGN